MTKRELMTMKGREEGQYHAQPSTDESNLIESVGLQNLYQERLHPCSWGHARKKSLEEQSR